MIAFRKQNCEAVISHGLGDLLDSHSPLSFIFSKTSTPVNATSSEGLCLTLLVHSGKQLPKAQWMEIQTTLKPNAQTLVWCTMVYLVLLHKKDDTSHLDGNRSHGRAGRAKINPSNMAFKRKYADVISPCLPVFMLILESLHMPFLKTEPKIRGSSVFSLECSCFCRFYNFFTQFMLLVSYYGKWM